MSKSYWRVRVIVEQCDPAGGSLEGKPIIFAKEIEGYRMKSSFVNKHKAVGRFNAVVRIIRKEYE